MLDMKLSVGKMVIDDDNVIHADDTIAEELKEGFENNEDNKDKKMENIENIVG